MGAVHRAPTLWWPPLRRSDLAASQTVRIRRMSSARAEPEPEPRMEPSAAAAAGAEASTATICATSAGRVYWFGRHPQNASWKNPLGRIHSPKGACGPLLAELETLSMLGFREVGICHRRLVLRVNLLTHAAGASPRSYRSTCHSGGRCSRSERSVGLARSTAGPS